MKKPREQGCGQALSGQQPQEIIPKGVGAQAELPGTSERLGVESSVDVVLIHQIELGLRK